MNELVFLDLDGMDMGMGGILAREKDERMLIV
jgi:hypothetical protein